MGQQLNQKNILSPVARAVLNRTKAMFNRSKAATATKPSIPHTSEYDKGDYPLGIGGCNFRIFAEEEV